MFLGGTALGVWAAGSMTTRGRGTPLPIDAASQPLTTGPYAFIHNPMAVSAVLQNAGVALARRSALASAVPVEEIAVWELVLRPAEERFLERQFGPSYVDHRTTSGTGSQPDPRRKRAARLSATSLDNDRFWPLRGRPYARSMGGRPARPRAVACRSALVV
jgi:Phospholipid methyltransferase